MNLELKDKVVLITGTNNPEGIGAATALAFAKEGAKVAMVYKKLNHSYDRDKIGSNGFDRYHEALSRDCSILEKEIKKITSDYLIIEGDIRKQENVVAIFETVAKRFGTVNVLVNNACGYPVNDTIFTITEKDINDGYDVDVKGVIFMIQEFVKRFSKFYGYSPKETSLQERLVDRSLNKDMTGGMPKLHGRIINMSTDAAQVMPGVIAYGSSKAAVEALTRSIAMEVGHLGITVNTVAPGPTQTGYIDKELENSVLPSIPLGRLGEPEDIANMILFFASDKASWITGQVIKVSGGHAL